MVTNALELSEGHEGPDWCFKGPAKGRHVGQHVVLQACERSGGFQGRVGLVSQFGV